MRNEAGMEWGRCGTGRGWNGMSAGERMRHFKPLQSRFRAARDLSGAPGSHARLFAHIDM